MVFHAMCCVWGQTVVSQLRAGALWLVTLAAMMGLVYALYPTFHGHTLSPALNLLYGTLARLLWALALVWLVYSCTAGHAGA